MSEVTRSVFLRCFPKVFTFLPRYIIFFVQPQKSRYIILKQTFDLERNTFSVWRVFFFLFSRSVTRETWIVYCSSCWRHAELVPFGDQNLVQTIRAFFFSFSEGFMNNDPHFSCSNWNNNCLLSFLNDIDIFDGGPSFKRKT